MSKEIEDAIKKAKETVEKMNLEEPYKSLTYSKLLENFLNDIKKEQKQDVKFVIDSENEIKSKTSADYIINLLKGDFGNLPRSLSEIDNSLRDSAIFYSKDVLGTTLIRLVRKGVLRRIREKEGYKYVLAVK